MKKILILEDNKNTLRHLAAIVREADAKCEVIALDNIKDAYKCALERKIDLFIIDIILDTRRPGDSSGLRFVDSIRKINNYAFTPVLFVTSLEDSKLYAYEKLHCYNFVEKPFDTDKVRQMVAHCLKFPGFQEEDKTLYFRKDGIVLAVDRSDIVYAESVNHIMYIHTRRSDTLEIPYLTLKRLLDEADSPDIIQCSRSAIINKRFVHNVDMTNRIIQLRDNYGRVEIGLMYKKLLKEIFK